MNEKRKKKVFSQSCGALIRPNDLDRDERELRKPKNWGEINFKSMLERYGPLVEGNVAYRAKSKPRQTLAPNERVSTALLEHQVEEGTLDATEVLTTMNDIDLVDFFKRFPNCKSLVMQNWSDITSNVLRAIAMTMGEHLIELDLSNSKVHKEHLEILFSRIRQLKILRINNCPNIDGVSMKLIVQICAKSLTEVYCNNCHFFRIEPFHWMGGCIGLHAPKLSKLRVLDISSCPAEDRGLFGLAEGCKHIRFLNLEACTSLSDAGIIAIIKANKSLRVINLAGCVDITDKTPQCIASVCSNISSLNLNRCNKISDKGLSAIGKKCKSLQALNIAGMSKVSEGALFDMARNCTGLIMLNVTGCQEVSQMGLKSLIQGMPYVEEAKTFSGFKPKEEHIELKLSGQLLMINDLAASKIARNYRNCVERRQVKRMMEIVKRDQMSKVIQDYMRRYMIRLTYYHMWRNRVYATSTLLLQRVWRGVLGRRKAAIAREFAARKQALVPYVIMFQRMYRGNQSRKKFKYVADAIRTMYESRHREASIGIVVKLQSCTRRRLASWKVDAWRELVYRRRHDQHEAAIVLQCLVRCALAKIERKKLKLIQDRLGDIRNRSASRIQAFYRASKGKYSSKLSRQEMQMVQKRRFAASIVLQRYVRGHNGRKAAQQMRIYHTLKHCAAREIQRVFRGRRVIHWRDMRMNVIASFVLDRQYLERLDRMEAARMRYQQFLEDIKRDSASESEDEDPAGSIKWTELWDDKLQVRYWVSNITGEKTFDEPADEEAGIKALLNKRVKVLWVAQNEWYEGFTSSYHRRKGRFRIDYDDGDHEWLDILKNEERVQIQGADGNWVMLNMHRSEELLYEKEKKLTKLHNIDAKADAWRDAKQWTRISEDGNRKIMFISDISGAIRAGAEDALEWVIQDDGMGFPCFYNIETQATVFDDPRFVSDAGEDIEEQRDFVMQELRYAVYFCKDLLDTYRKAEFERKEAMKAYQLKLIARSNKPKLMTAFLIRAKALYTPQSVVDRPCPEIVEKELEYASWLASEIATLVSMGEETKMKSSQKKTEALQSVLGATTYYNNPDSAGDTQGDDKQPRRRVYKGKSRKKEPPSE